MKDKKLWIKVRDLGEEDPSRGTSHRVDGLVWAALGVAAHDLEIKRSELINELLIAGLAERGFYVLRVHGTEEERQDFSEFLRNRPEAVVYEHNCTDVLEELVVRLAVQP